MKKYFILLLIVSGLIAACTKAPISGRKQLILLPESQLTTLALSQYKAVLSDSKIAKNEDAAVVDRIGKKIARAVETYLRKNGQASKIKNFKWETHVIDEPTINAWAMPGGKIAVYTGILPVAKTETGLAVVMGHEVAHAVARHGNERMSQGLLQQLGGAALSIALANKPAETQNMFMQAYGIGTQVGVMLPFSRKQETEADELGLVFMAMAGYDPSEAPKFWQRMSQGSKGQTPPEFMSTHPSHSTRISNLTKFLVKAKKYYRPSASNAKDYVFTSKPSPATNTKNPRTSNPTTTKPKTTNPTTTKPKTSTPTKSKSGSVKGKIKTPR